MMRRMGTTVVFETDRLRAVRWQVRHAEAAYPIWSLEEVVRFLGNPVPHPSVEHTRAWIEGIRAAYDTGVPGQGYWAVERRDGGELVGATLCRALPGGDGEVEIGWTLAPWHQGKGYATEAGAGTARYAFDVLGLTEVYAIVDAANAPSIRVAQRIGMHHLGSTTKYYDGWCGELFQITADEFRAAARAAPRR